jgi:hypothetical protein
MLLSIRSVQRGAARLHKKPRARVTPERRATEASRTGITAGAEGKKGP